MTGPLYNEFEERQRWLDAQAQNRSRARQEEAGIRLGNGLNGHLLRGLGWLVILLGWLVWRFPRTSLVLGVAGAVAGTIWWRSTK